MKRFQKVKKYWYRNQIQNTVKQVRAEVVAPDVCEALYNWFIDVRGTLKTPLPRKMLKAQAKFLYDQWRDQQTDGKVPPDLVFSDP